MSDFSVQFDAVELINRLLKAIRNADTVFDKAIHKTAEMVRTNVIKGIRDQSYDHAPLSDKYAKWKERHSGNTGILMSGVRKANIPHPRGGKNVDVTPKPMYVTSFAVEKEKSYEYLVGSNYVQARALEFGNPKTNLPARPHLSEAMKDTYDDYIEFIKQAFKELFP